MHTALRLVARAVGGRPSTVIRQNAISARSYAEPQDRGRPSVSWPVLREDMPSGVKASCVTHATQREIVAYQLT